MTDDLREFERTLADDGLRLEFDSRPIVAPPVPIAPARRATLEEDIARASRVPYWLISSRPRPSILRRPIWRLRSWRWTR